MRFLQTNYTKAVRRLAGISTIVLSIVAGLGLAELSVRKFRPQLSGEVVYLYDEQLGTIPVPGQKGRKIPPAGPSYDFSHNSLGFRGTREYSDVKTGLRVLFLGDSYTYGVGVNDDQAFPYQVEKILTAKNYPVEIINGGNPGKGSDYELRLLRTLGSRLKPDLTVVCFFWNDFSDNVEGEYYRLAANGELAPQSPHSLAAKKARVENLPVIRWLLSKSQAANLIKAAVIDLLKKSPTPPSQAAVSRQHAPVASETQKHVTRVLFSQMIKTAQDLGSDILFCYLPDAQGVGAYRESGRISGYEQSYNEIISSLPAKSFSLTAPLTSVNGAIGLQYWGHWSAACHQEAARVISSVIETWLLQQKQTAPFAQD